MRRLRRRWVRRRVERLNKKEMVEGGEDDMSKERGV